MSEVVEWHGRFWAKVQRGDGCWEWQGSRSVKGYGRFMLHGKARWAHRVVWQIERGLIPDGLSVCHHCDNPPCVRPDHLFVGTKSANMLDMSAKGRAYMQIHPERMAGERASAAKLTAEKVRSIRVRHAAGATRRGLAREFGVARRSIDFILSRTTWRHVD